jgi:pimeloyl-ACP methyl ester carboxylesterase
VTGLAPASPPALLDHLGVSRVAVLGHSTGGMTAVRFTLMNPDRVARLGDFVALSAAAARDIPRATRVVVPQCGHIPHLEHPACSWPGYCRSWPAEAQTPGVEWLLCPLGRRGRHGRWRSGRPGARIADRAR